MKIYNGISCFKVSHLYGFNMLIIDGNKLSFGGVRMEPLSNKMKFVIVSVFFIFSFSMSHSILKIPLVHLHSIDEIYLSSSMREAFVYVSLI